jgi:type III pantothenate kinase
VLRCEAAGNNGILAFTDDWDKRNCGKMLVGLAGEAVQRTMPLVLQISDRWRDVLKETQPLILAIDVGNSRIKCGLLDMTVCAQSNRLPPCQNVMAVAVADDIPWNNVSAWMNGAELCTVTAVIAGSNPDRIQRLMKDWPLDGPTEKSVIDNFEQIPLTVDLPEPGRVGIDRLLNAVAANQIRPEKTPAIIVDCGTATTVDYLSATGAFAGGAILPGFELSARSLHQYTARLPLIDVTTLNHSPPNPLGRDTTAAIQSGLFWGQLGAVRELIARLSDESVNPLILLTGGGGNLLQPYIPEATYEPHLSLQGLALSVQSEDV